MEQKDDIVMCVLCYYQANHNSRLPFMTRHLKAVADMKSLNRVF